MGYAASRMLPGNSHCSGNTGCRVPQVSHDVMGFLIDAHSEIEGVDVSIENCPRRYHSSDLAAHSRSEHDLVVFAV
jgi:hypothetical protein